MLDRGSTTGEDGGRSEMEYFGVISTFNGLLNMCAIHPAAHVNRAKHACSPIRHYCSMGRVFSVHLPILCNFQKLFAGVRFPRKSKRSFLQSSFPRRFRIIVKDCPDLSISSIGWKLCKAVSITSLKSAVYGRPMDSSSFSSPTR